MTSTIPVQIPYRPEFFLGLIFTTAQVVFIAGKIVLIFIIVVVAVAVAVAVVGTAVVGAVGAVGAVDGVIRSLNSWALINLQ